MERSKRNGLAIYAGGNHIFYIAGVLKYLTEKGLQFDAVATYSSGSAILPFLIDGDFGAAPTIFGKLLDQNSRNIYPANLFTRADVFPHDQIYSTAVHSIVDFKKATEYTRPLRVIVSRYAGSEASSKIVGLLAMIALLANSLAKTATPSLFLTGFKSLFSITGEIVDIRQCASADELANVILGSSTIYPFIRIRRRDGQAMFDGKLCLTSPIDALQDCENVLSIHAHHSFLPQRDHLTSIFPVSKVEVGALNYVGSAGIKSAFAQGYREGAQHYARLVNSSFFGRADRG